MEKRLKFQYYENETDHHLFKTNLLYLEKTIAFCSANNIDLYLLNAPLHPFYKSKIPDDFTNEYKKVIDVLNTKVMDLSTTPLSDSCYIPDGDHLSIKGSTKFTKDFFVNQYLTRFKAIIFEVLEFEKIHPPQLLQDILLGITLNLNLFFDYQTSNLSFDVE